MSNQERREIASVKRQIDYSRKRRQLLQAEVSFLQKSIKESIQELREWDIISSK
jgi:septal ring factor EnvC (AmiA/AmiB activator)